MPNKCLPPQTDTATRTASTPIQGEIFYDTDENQLYYGDGATQGGVVVGGAGAFADLSDVDTTGLQTGQAMVWNGVVWVPGSSSSGREVLTADRTYYVRTDGSDSNDGLTDSAGGAFLTIQKAIDTVSTLDLSIFNAIIQVQDATWTNSLTLKTIIGAGKAIIRGNTTTPANVVLTNNTADLRTITGENYQGVWELEGVKINNPQQSCIFINNGKLNFKNVIFDTPLFNHIVGQQRAVIKATGDYQIIGTLPVGGFHIDLRTLSYAEISNRTITSSITPLKVRAFLGYAVIDAVSVTGPTISATIGTGDGGYVRT